MCVFGVGWQDISLMALACFASHLSKFALGGTPPALPAFEQVRSNLRSLEGMGEAGPPWGAAQVGPTTGHQTLH